MGGRGKEMEQHSLRHLCEPRGEVTVGEQSVASREQPRLDPASNCIVPFASDMTTMFFSISSSGYHSNIYD